MSTRTIVQIATVASLAWGAFAFGATYAWASQPLMVGCVVAGVLAWRAAGSASSAPPTLSIGLLVSLGLLAVVISVQVLPMPAAAVSVLSPQALTSVTQLDLSYAVAPGWHPLSIAPGATRHGLSLFVAFALLMIGLTRFLSLTGTRWLSWSLTGVGVVLALTGIIQKATYTGRIYGFWVPQMNVTPFGPFVNRNHFAGWMLMALPLTLGLLCSGIARGMAHVRPTFRDRALWFASREANDMLLLLTAAAVMGLSLVLTMSRSGITAFLLVIALIGTFVLFGVRARTRRSVAGLLLIGLAVLVATWVGLDAIVTRFAALNAAEWQARPDAWADARDIARMFPWTGTGLNTYGVATLLFQRRQLTAHYAQAHNDYLQLLAEGGLLVAIPTVLFLGVLAYEVRRRFRDDAPHSLSSWWARAGAVTGLVTIALQAVVDFSLQMPANGALFTVLCAIALHRAPARRAPPTLP